MAPASLRATWAKAREKPQVYRAPFWGSALLGFRVQGLEVWRFGSLRFRVRGFEFRVFWAWGIEGLGFRGYRAWGV